MCIHRQRRLFESRQDILTPRDNRKAKKLLYHRNMSHSEIVPKRRRFPPPPSYTENAGDKSISAREHQVIILIFFRSWDYKQSDLTGIDETGGVDASANIEVENYLDTPFVLVP
jgi:hypothetical protein